MTTISIKTHLELNNNEMSAYQTYERRPKQTDKLWCASGYNVSGKTDGPLPTVPKSLDLNNGHKEQIRTKHTV